MTGHVPVTHDRRWVIAIEVVTPTTRALTATLLASVGKRRTGVPTERRTRIEGYHRELTWRQRRQAVLSVVIPGPLLPEHAELRLPAAQRYIGIPVRFSRREVPQARAELAGRPTAAATAAPAAGERVVGRAGETGEVTGHVAVDDDILAGVTTSRRAARQATPAVAEVQGLDAADLDARKLEGRLEVDAALVGLLSLRLQQFLVLDAAVTSPRVDAHRSRWSPTVIIRTETKSN